MILKMHVGALGPNVHSKAGGKAFIEANHHLMVVDGRALGAGQQGARVPHERARLKMLPVASPPKPTTFHKWPTNH